MSPLSSLKWSVGILVITVVSIVALEPGPTSDRRYVQWGMLVLSVCATVQSAVMLWKNSRSRGK